MTRSPTPYVAPSILSADFAHLAGAIHLAEDAGAQWLHVDVMDGHFVPNLTIGPPVVKAIRPHIRGVCDCHLMIKRPEQSLHEYIAAGADVVTVHAEACTHLHRTLSLIHELSEKMPADATGRKLARVRAGVALNPHTPVEVLRHVLDQVDLVLLMSVNPGWGGQKFIAETLRKARDFAALLGHLAEPRKPIELQIDGGVSLDNIAQIARAGFTVIVAGNAVFGAQDPAHAWRDLQHRAEGATALIA